MFRAIGKSKIAFVLAILFGISRWLVKENIVGWKTNYAAYHPTRFLRPKNGKD